VGLSYVASGPVRWRERRSKDPSGTDVTQEKGESGTFFDSPILVKGGEKKRDPAGEKKTLGQTILCGEKNPMQPTNAFP